MNSFQIHTSTFPPPLPKPQYSSSKQNPIKPINPKPHAADSTDWIASTLTRRYGLAAGLAWSGLLFVGVISEQIKTRFDASQQQSNAKDIANEEETKLPNGMTYYDGRVGGGASPRHGDLVVISLKGWVSDGGGVFVDTFGEGKRALALVVGSRPYAKGMCEGVEMMLRSMRAGGRRRVVVPPELGFGDEGADFGEGVVVSPGKMVEFVVELDKVSIAPS